MPIDFKAFQHDILHILLILELYRMCTMQGSSLKHSIFQSI